MSAIKCNLSHAYCMQFACDKLNAHFKAITLINSINLSYHTKENHSIENNLEMCRTCQNLERWSRHPFKILEKNRTGCPPITDSWVSLWLSRLIMCGVEFWSVTRAPHVSSTKRNWYCLPFPNFPPWTPRKHSWIPHF